MELLLAVVLALAAVGVALWTYLRREPPVRGRALLAALRGSSLFLLVLLLWNPVLPVEPGSGDAAAPGLLLDASLSMTAVRADSSGTEAEPWSRALERAREMSGPDERVLVFGSSVRSVPLDSLAGRRALDTGSRLAPALERAAALGARSVRVLSDFRLEDPVAVTAVLEETGLGVRFENVGGATRNVGIAEVEEPGALDPGEDGSLEVLLEGDPGTGDGADSVALELRSDGRLLAARRVPLPPPGRGERHALEFTAPDDRGTHRLEVSATLEGDGFGPDDRRLAFLEVDPARAGLVLLSLTPDWEPRYLLPVLEQVTGLDAGGFLRMEGGRWLPVGREAIRSGPLDEGAVREAAEEAGFIVLHGAPASPPGWIRALATGADRLLVFPEEAGGAELAGLAGEVWTTGEWYPVAELPASPLAGDLAGAAFEGLPPLTAVLEPAASLPPGRVPLSVRRGRRGAPRPALALVDEGERRSVVVLGSGFWRWAARDGPPREAYRRLWSAAAGWLMESPAPETSAGVEPAARPVPRGQPVEWRVRGETGDTLQVVLRSAPGDSLVLDSGVVRAGSRLRTPPLAPGRYAYRIRSPELAEDLTGKLEVSPYSAELLRPGIEPPGVAGRAEGEDRRTRSGRPLRTHPAPYLLLLALLSAEWIGRRRQGLR